MATKKEQMAHPRAKAAARVSKAIAAEQRREQRVGSVDRLLFAIYDKQLQRILDAAGIRTLERTAREKAVKELRTILEEDRDDREEI